MYNFGFTLDQSLAILSTKSKLNIPSCKTAYQTAFKYSDNKGVQLAYFIVEIIIGQ